MIHKYITNLDDKVENKLIECNLGEDRNGFALITMNINNVGKTESSLDNYIYETNVYTIEGDNYYSSWPSIMNCNFIYNLDISKLQSNKNHYGMFINRINVGKTIKDNKENDLYPTLTLNFIDKNNNSNLNKPIDIRLEDLECNVVINFEENITRNKITIGTKNCKNVSIKNAEIKNIKQMIRSELVVETTTLNLNNDDENPVNVYRTLMMIKNSRFPQTSRMHLMYENPESEVDNPNTAIIENTESEGENLNTVIIGNPGFLNKNVTIDDNSTGYVKYLDIDLLNDFYSITPIPVKMEEMASLLGGSENPRSKFTAAKVNASVGGNGETNINNISEDERKAVNKIYNTYKEHNKLNQEKAYLRDGLYFNKSTNGGASIEKTISVSSDIIDACSQLKRKYYILDGIIYNYNQNAHASSNIYKRDQILLKIEPNIEKKQITYTFNFDTSNVDTTNDIAITGESIIFSIDDYEDRKKAMVEPIHTYSQTKTNGCHCFKAREGSKVTFDTNKLYCLAFVFYSSATNSNVTITGGLYNDASKTYITSNAKNQDVTAKQHYSLKHYFYGDGKTIDNDNNIFYRLDSSQSIELVNFAVYDVTDIFGSIEIDPKLYGALRDDRIYAPGGQGYNVPIDTTIENGVLSPGLLEGDLFDSRPTNSNNNGSDSPFYNHFSSSYPLDLRVSIAPYRNTMKYFWYIDNDNYHIKNINLMANGEFIKVSRDNTKIESLYDPMTSITINNESAIIYRISPDILFGETSNNEYIEKLSNDGLLNSWDGYCGDTYIVTNTSIDLNTFISEIKLQNGENINAHEIEKNGFNYIVRCKDNAKKVVSNFYYVNDSYGNISGFDQEKITQSNPSNAGLLICGYDQSYTRGRFFDKKNKLFKDPDANIIVEVEEL